jgi:hypothetical protein
MWALEIIIRMNQQVDRGGIRLTFITLVMKKQSLNDTYPGGVRGFLDKFPYAQQDDRLVAVSAMSGGEIDEVLEHLEEVGFDVENGCAIGDQFGGPFKECPGIEFYRSRPDRPMAPRWMAVAAGRSS